MKTEDDDHNSDVIDGWIIKTISEWIDIMIIDKQMKDDDCLVVDGDDYDNDED